VRHARRDLARAPDLAARRTIERTDSRRRGPDRFPRMARPSDLRTPSLAGQTTSRRADGCWRDVLHIESVRGVGTRMNGSRANALRITCGTCAFRIADESWPSG